MSALPMETTVPLAAQIAEVEREIKLREFLYPKWVQRGRLTQRNADNCLAAMRAVLQSLKNLEAA